MWKPSDRPVVGSTFSCLGIWVKWRWLPGTTSGLSFGYNACGTHGNALRRVLKSMISLVGVPSLANSSLVRCSLMVSLPLWVATASWMEKPSHMCATMSRIGTASLVFMLGGGVVLVWAACLPASLVLRLALCVSLMGSFLACGVGVVSARLMTAWFGAAG